MKVSVAIYYFDVFPQAEKPFFPRKECDKQRVERMLIRGLEALVQLCSHPCSPSPPGEERDYKQDQENDE